MPGFTIHIAIAKNYIDKHQGYIKDEEAFIKGSLAPDLEEDMKHIRKDKSTSHYGKCGRGICVIDIDLFFKDKKIDMKKDYWKGYLLHLIADHYFNNILFKEEVELLRKRNDTFYDDYNYLNNVLMERYQLQPIKDYEEYMEPVEGTPRYLNYNKVTEFIEKISSIDLENALIKKEEEEQNR